MSFTKTCAGRRYISSNTRYAYIMLAHVDSLALKMIRFFTKMKYNHVSICINADSGEFFSFGRKYIHIPIFGGFIQEKLNSGIYRHFKNPICAIFRIELNDEMHRSLIAQIEGFKKCRNRYRYNYLALIGYLLRIPVSMKSRFTCSEFVATLIQNCGAHEFLKPLSLIHPMDFSGIPGITPVYEGEMPTSTGAMPIFP